MAQYPQGIFQSLQYLLKKVKILALQKQPTYSSISTASAPYVIPGRGIYEIVDNADVLIFPDPTLCNGQTIIVINTNTGVQPIAGPYQPYYYGSTEVIDQLPIQSYNTFVSINGEWRGSTQIKL
jgi:hypothetical protein